MQKYIDALHAYLAENELKHRCPNVNSLLDMLYCCYRQDCEFDTQEIRACIDALYQAAESADPVSGDDIFIAVSKLCCAYQSQAFHEGVAIGLRLYSELYSHQ